MSPLRLTKLAAVVALIACAPVAASAAPDTSPTVAPLTVIARHRLTPQQPRREVIQGFVAQHGAPTHIGQLARWNDPICATTSGLPPQFDALVTARVREVAADVGASNASAAHCEPNLVIFFTTDPQALLDGIRKRTPQLLGFHYAAQAVAAAAVTHPIQGWYVTATRDDRGRLTYDDPAAATPDMMALVPAATTSPGAKIADQIKEAAGAR